MAKVIDGASYSVTVTVVPQHGGHQVIADDGVYRASCVVLDNDWNKGKASIVNYAMVEALRAVTTTRENERALWN